MEATTLKTLSYHQIKERLKQLPGWETDGMMIRKKLEFSDFVSAACFFNRCAFFFEKMDHHPETNLSYKILVFTLTSHEAGDKLTKVDFLVAKEIDRLYKTFSI